MQELQIAIPQEMENMKLPDPALLGYYKDEESRTFWAEGEIDENILELSKMIIRYNREDYGIPVEKRKPIKIFISSPGGLLDEARSLVQLIMISKTPIWTIDACYAYSAASLILLSGHKRFALPGTKCLFHSGSGATQGTFEQIQAANEDYKKEVKQMQDYIISRTKIDSKLLNKKRSYDWYISDSEMVDLGIVDKIITDIDEVV